MSDPRLHDSMAAGIRLAMTYRLFYDYLAMRQLAQNAGADVSALPERGWTEIRDAHNELVDEWIIDRPSSARAAMALVDFVTLTMLDRLFAEMMQDSTIAGQERDQQHALQALASLSEWMRRAEMAEAVDRIRSSTPG